MKEILEGFIFLRNLIRQNYPRYTSKCNGGKCLIINQSTHFKYQVHLSAVGSLPITNRISFAFINSK